MKKDPKVGEDGVGSVGEGAKRRDRLEERKDPIPVARDAAPVLATSTPASTVVANNGGGAKSLEEVGEASASRRSS